MRSWLLCLWLLGHASGELTFGWRPRSTTSTSLIASYADPESGRDVRSTVAVMRHEPTDPDDVSGVVFIGGADATGACESVEEPMPQEPYIVFVQPGRCLDRAEVLDNASAVVIYEDDGSVDEANFKTRPLAVISAEDGRRLSRLAANGTRVLLRIRVQRRRLVEAGRADRASVFLVAMVFVVVMVTSLCWLLFFYVQRFRLVYGKDTLTKTLCSAAKKALEKIPVKTVKNKDSDHEDDCECCAICIEPFQYGELIRSLPCDHSFHQICIDPWLLEQRSCPMCKLDILRHFGLIYTGSQESVLEMYDEQSISSGRLSPPLDQEVLVVPNQRRRSSVTLAVSRKDERRPSAVVVDVPDIPAAEVPSDDDSDAEIWIPPPTIRRKSHLKDLADDEEGIVD